MKNRAGRTLLILAALVGFAGEAQAADNAVDAVDAHVNLFNHAFDPPNLTLPAGRKIKLTVTNRDALSADFKSYDLSLEKTLPANGEIYVYLGPLAPGQYDFFDDLHHDTNGKIIVR